LRKPKKFLKKRYDILLAACKYKAEVIRKMVFFLAVYRRGLVDESGNPHKDPWITERIVIYGFAEEQVIYSVPKGYLRRISPGDYLVTMRFDGPRLNVDTLSEVVCVFTPTPLTDKQIRIPELHSREEASKWAFDQIERLPVGVEDREEFKKAFVPEEPTFTEHHLIHPDGPVVLARKLIDLDAEVSLEDVRKMARGKKEAYEANLKSIQGFARHVRPVPDQIVFRWILETARKRRLIFFSK